MTRLFPFPNAGNTTAKSGGGGEDRTPDLGVMNPTPAYLSRFRLIKNIQLNHCKCGGSGLISISECFILVSVDLVVTGGQLSGQ